MITELTPETYFQFAIAEGTLNVVMHYGTTCGPCKITMPHYEVVVQHFLDHGKTHKVKFYRFDQWLPEHKPFIAAEGLGVKGVPTFKYYYGKSLVEEVAKSYTDPNVIKQQIVDVVHAIDKTMGGFSLD